MTQEEIDQYIDTTFFEDFDKVLLTYKSLIG